MISKENYKITRTLTGRVEKGEDLLLAIGKILEEENIQSGIIGGIGATSCANLAWFNQETKEYEEKFFDEPMEIVNLSGNISLREGKIFPHIHISLSKRDFTTIGGHLLPKTFVFACELYITSFDGTAQKREFDPESGLFLWR